MKLTPILAALAGALTLTFGATAFAASGDSSGGNTPVVCKTGYVYSKAKQICVKSSAGLVDDKELYEQGHALAKAGHYAAALTALNAIEDMDDSMVLTMIGYSLRKSGHWDDGVAYYQRALAIDPNNVNTREYLGEAYLAKGRVDLAQEQLVKIETIAGTESEQYVELAFAIAEGSTW